jgi:hypothetical protein
MQLRKIAGILINVISLYRILKKTFIIWMQNSGRFFFFIFRAALNDKKYPSAFLIALYVTIKL